MHLKFLTQWIKHLTSLEVGGEGGICKLHIKGVVTVVLGNTTFS